MGQGCFTVPLHSVSVCGKPRRASSWILFVDTGTFRLLSSLFLIPTVLLRRPSSVSVTKTLRALSGSVLAVCATSTRRTARTRRTLHACEASFFTWNKLPLCGEPGVCLAYDSSYSSYLLPFIDYLKQLAFDFSLISPAFPFFPPHPIVLVCGVRQHCLLPVRKSMVMLRKNSFWIMFVLFCKISISRFVFLFLFFFCEYSFHTTLYRAQVFLYWKLRTVEEIALWWLHFGGVCTHFGLFAFIHPFVAQKTSMASYT